MGSDFEEIVRRYAGARAMAQESTEYRQEYADKADTHLRTLLRWLRERLVSSLYVVYQGVDQPVQTVLTQMRSTASQSIEDLIRLVSSHLVAPEFEEKYPGYPKFPRLTQPVTETSRANSAMEAIRLLCGRGRTNLAMGILEGLGLIDVEGNIRPYDSPFTNHFLQILTSKPENQVVNRGEVIEQVAGGIQPIEKDLEFHLEPEWVVVLLLALVYNGDLVLSLDGREELDAGSLERALTRSMVDLTDFRFYKRPRGLPLPLWEKIFEGLGLRTGLIRDENTRENAVQELQRLVNNELESTVQLQDRLQQGALLWNEPVFTDRFTMMVEGGAVVTSDQPNVSFSINELMPGLRGNKQFLEDLKKFNTVGKLRNLRLTPGQIQEALNDRERVLRARRLMELVGQIQPVSAYLAEAIANLPDAHAWVQKAKNAQQEMLEQVRLFGKGEAALDLPAALRSLKGLKDEYIRAYSELHRNLLLTSKGDELRQRLYRDARFEALRSLSEIDLLNRGGELDSWKNSLTSLLPCPGFHEGMLSETPTCPHCHLRPSQVHSTYNADQMVHNLDERLSMIFTNWRQALKTNLNSETAQRSLSAMSPSEKQPIEAFLEQSEDAETIPTGFTPAAIQALRGIRAVTLVVDDLLEALKAGGLPCTREELARRFKNYLDQQMRGHDAVNTRITMDQ